MAGPQATLVVHHEKGPRLLIHIDAVDNAVDAHASQLDGLVVAEGQLVCPRDEALRQEALALQRVEKAAAHALQLVGLHLAHGHEGPLHLALGINRLVPGARERPLPAGAVHAGHDARHARLPPQLLVETLQHQVAEAALGHMVGEGGVQAARGQAALVEPAKRAVDERLQGARRPGRVPGHQHVGELGVVELQRGRGAAQQGRDVRRRTCELGESLLAQGQGGDAARSGQARGAVELPKVAGVIAIAVDELLEQGTGARGLGVLIGKQALHHHDVAGALQRRAEAMAQQGNLAGGGRQAERLPQAHLGVHALTQWIGVGREVAQHHGAGTQGVEVGQAHDAHGIGAGLQHACLSLGRDVARGQAHPAVLDRDHVEEVDQLVGLGVAPQDVQVGLGHPQDGRPRTALEIGLGRTRGAKPLLRHAQHPRQVALPHMRGGRRRAVSVNVDRGLSAD